MSADASEAVLNQYLAPYVGCTIGEYFRDQKQDVLIIYDDLSNHAIAFREMSLLLRRAPGREAYPGDVFYLHSRLLERAGKLATWWIHQLRFLLYKFKVMISLHIFLQILFLSLMGRYFWIAKLFNQGIRPAVNIELSVSRVAVLRKLMPLKK